MEPTAWDCSGAYWPPLRPVAWDYSIACCPPGASCLRLFRSMLTHPLVLLVPDSWVYRLILTPPPVVLVAGFRSMLTHLWCGVGCRISEHVDPPPVALVAGFRSMLTHLQWCWLPDFGACWPTPWWWRLPDFGACWPTRDEWSGIGFMCAHSEVLPGRSTASHHIPPLWFVKAGIVLQSHTPLAQWYSWNFSIRNKKMKKYDVILAQLKNGVYLLMQCQAERRKRTAWSNKPWQTTWNRMPLVIN